MQKPIKVLQLTCPNGFYGAERWIIALARNLDPIQVTCSLAVTIEPNCTDHKVAEHFSALGRQVHEITMHSRFDISVIAKLCRLVKSENIEVIHSHGYKSDIIGLIVARISGIKAVSTPHGFVNVEDWKLRWYYNIGNQMFRWFDMVVPLSQQLCTDVHSFGVKESKIKYIQNGVDIDEILEVQVAQSMDSQCSKENDVKRIGFIGQITKRKNVYDILDVFEMLASKHANLELVLLGDGEQLDALQHYANTLQSGKKIRFLGFQTNRLHWLKTFDLFVMTSHLEGIPRCLMEAMAMGVPVAAYDITGIDQLIVNNQTGLLVPFGDKESLAKAWERLLFDDASATSARNSAKAFIDEHFSGRRMALEYTALYENLLGLEQRSKSIDIKAKS